MEDTLRDGMVTPILAALDLDDANVTGFSGDSVVVHDGPGMGDNWVEILHETDLPLDSAGGSR